MPGSALKKWEIYANRGDVRSAVLAEHFCKNVPMHITDTLIGKLTYTSSLSLAPCPDYQWPPVRCSFQLAEPRPPALYPFTIVVSFLFMIFAILILIIGDLRFTEKFGYDVFQFIVRLSATHVTRWNVIENSRNNFTVIHFLKDRTYTLPIKSFSQ